MPTDGSAAAPRADLVLEGGGVKGIALTGAVATLARAGYTFPRVAGTSAGAVVAAFLAALQRAGEPVERLEDVARTLDYRRLRDRGAVGRAAGPLARVVDGFSLAFDGGVFSARGCTVLSATSGCAPSATCAKTTPAAACRPPSATACS